MKRAFLITFIGLFLAFSLSTAWGQTQADLNETSAKAFKKADEALNVAYKELVGKLDEEGKKKLQAAQRAWLKYRDAECDSQADEYRGGSIMPLIYNNCAEHLPEARTTELKTRLKNLNDF